jgi:hypothetical protein
MKNRTHKACVVFCLLIYSCNNNTRLPGNINTRASLPDSIQLTVSGLKVLTTFINRKAGTTSVLYGNPLALREAAGLNKEVVGGEIFTLVTWKQQPDTHWFGAQIPGDFLSAEQLKTDSAGQAVVLNYRRYEGNRFVPDSDTLYKSGRIRFILAQRPSVMP